MLTGLRDGEEPIENQQDTKDSVTAKDYERHRAHLDQIQPYAEWRAAIRVIWPDVAILDFEVPLHVRDTRSNTKPYHSALRELANLLDTITRHSYAAKSPAAVFTYPYLTAWTARAAIHAIRREHPSYGLPNLESMIRTVVLDKPETLPPVLSSSDVAEVLRPLLDHIAESYDISMSLDELLD